MGATLSSHPAPCVAELVGPPGVGKSSIATAVGAARSDIDLVRSMRPHRLSTTLSGAWRAAGSLPAVRAATPRRKVARLLVRAETAGTVTAARRRPASVVVFDQGPVYTLARLEVAGVGWQGRMGRWRARVLDDIADSLDLTIWLTCPPAVALDRIRARAKDHAARGQGVELVHAYQRAYGSLRRDLAERGTAEIEIDTGRGSVADATADVLSVLSCRGPEPVDGR